MTSNAINGGMLVPEPAMAQMFPTGTYVDLLNPDPATIHPEDIAHHGGMTCRYGGGVRRFYSVAEHAVLVADLLHHEGHSVEVQLAGLLHDAAESYVGDVISPLKYALRLVEARKARNTVLETDPDVLPALGDDNGAWFARPPRELRGVYSELSDGIDRAIGARFGIDPELFEHPDVKLADMWALKIEAAALTFGRGDLWRWPGTLPHGGELPKRVGWVGGMAPEKAAQEWLLLLEELAP